MYKICGLNEGSKTQGSILNNGIRAYLVTEGFSSLFMYQSENEHILLGFSPGFESVSFQSSARYQMVSKVSINHFLEGTLRMSWKQRTSSA